MSGALRVFVGTLFSGENELDQCVASLEMQTHRAWEQQVFRNLPNREAHEAIYSAFMERAGEFDLFLKLDADMVFRTPDDLARIVALFEADATLDHAQMAVHDHFSDELIMGVHCYRAGVRWRATAEDLFVDPYPEYAGRRADLRGEPAPIIDHCPDPSAYQAFHFGVHRALKAVQPGRTRAQFDPASSRAQLSFLQRTHANFQHTENPRLGLAVLGADMVFAGAVDLTRVDRKADELRAAFTDVEQLDAAAIRAQLSARWSHPGWTSFTHGLRAFARGFGRRTARLLSPPHPVCATPAASAPATGDCCAVVVNYRCAEDTQRCVESLRRHAPDVHVVIVENGSADGSADALRTAFASDDGVDLVVDPLNRGFGAGCNRGIAHAFDARPQTGHILLVNPDAVIEEDCVRELLATAERHPDAGIVGGLVTNMDGTSVQFENGRFKPWTLARQHVAAPDAEEFETTFVTGALMLIDAALLRAGLRFDERYFLYVEDVDLCCEVRARGRTLWVTKRAVIRHEMGGTQRDDEDLGLGMREFQLREQTRGKVLLARKRLPVGQRLVFLAFAVVAKPLAGVVAARSTRFLGPYFEGIRAGWRAPL